MGDPRHHINRTRPVSVFNTWEQRRTRMPQVRARIGPYSDERHESTFFRAEAENVGDVPTTLKAAGVILPGRVEVVWPPKAGHAEATGPMPYDLPRAATYQIGTRAESLAYIVSERGHS